MTTSPAPAEGGNRRTSIAIDASAIDVPPALAESFEQSLKSQLSGRSHVRLTAKARADLVVHGSARVLSHAKLAGGEMMVRCEVKLLLADRRQGTIRLLLSGRASATGRRPADALARSAVQAAIHGALSPLDERTLRSGRRGRPARS